MKELIFKMVVQLILQNGGTDNIWATTNNQIACKNKDIADHIAELLDAIGLDVLEPEARENGDWVVGVVA